MYEEFEIGMIIQTDLKFKVYKCIHIKVFDFHCNFSTSIDVACFSHFVNCADCCNKQMC